MFFQIIFVSTLFFFGSSEAKDFFLDSETDLGPNWEVNCTYGENVYDLREYQKCFRFINSYRDPEGSGYWSSCAKGSDKSRICSLTLTYPDDFIPRNVTLNLVNYDNLVAVSTAREPKIKEIGASWSSSKDWTTESVQIPPGFLSEDRKISFVVRGRGDTVIDSIQVSGEEGQVPCDPRATVHSGYCQKFYRCSPRGFLEEVSCPNDRNGDPIWWNLEKNSQHGGVCDLWVNLSQRLQVRYLEYPHCDAPSGYFPSRPCSRYYEYRGIGRGYSMTCSEDLIFNPASETCDFCFNVQKNKDGEMCCE